MNEDKIIDKLFEHDNRFDKVGNKIDNMTMEIFRRQDEIITILRRLDQERIFTASWIQRIEKEVEDHTREISRIKTELKIG